MQLVFCFVCQAKSFQFHRQRYDFLNEKKVLSVNYFNLNYRAHRKTEFFNFRDYSRPRASRPSIATGQRSKKAITESCFNIKIYVCVHVCSNRVYGSRFFAIRKLFPFMCTVKMIDPPESSVSNRVTVSNKSINHGSCKFVDNKND